MTFFVMNKRICLPLALVAALSGNLLMSGCAKKSQSVTPCDAGATQVLSFDTTVYALEKEPSPSCKLNFQLAFLSDDADSVAMRINRTIIETALGMRFTNTSPTSFLVSLSDSFISDYRADISELAEEDLKNSTQQKELPGWYNYEYDLSSALTPGMGDSIWNYVLTDFRQTGGAHPNTVKTYINIDAKTGECLKKSDVFSSEAESSLIPEIIKGIYDILNSYESFDMDIEPTLEGLRKAGVFEYTEPYIPDNFCLGKDTVTLYYNRYEIASYALGDFEVKLPLKSVKKYLIHHN